jgi:hypothetical protein
MWLSAGACLACARPPGFDPLNWKEKEFYKESKQNKQATG